MACYLAHMVPESQEWSVQVEREIESVLEKIRPHLAGRRPELVGVVLAELLSIWLAGHFIEDDADATDAMRKGILAAHLDAVGELVEVNARVMGTWQRA